MKPLKHITRRLRGWKLITEGRLKTWTRPVCIEELHIQLAQRGTCFKAVLSVPVQTQATNVERCFEMTYPGLCVWWNAIKFREDCIRLGELMQTTPGPFPISTSNFRPGLLFT